MARKPERGADEGRASAQRLSDVAYARILENLFDRQLPAGAFVSQNDLVTLLGIPVGPLRDALRVLEAEGVLKIHPRSGIEFVKPGLELTRSTYQFRSIIERAAVRMFAETASSELLEELRAEHRGARYQTGVRRDRSGRIAGVRTSRGAAAQFDRRHHVESAYRVRAIAGCTTTCVSSDSIAA